MPPLASLLSEVSGIAREAGLAILAHYHPSVSVQYKDDKSPLTAADTAAHELIVARLLRLTPDIPVLSEEGVESAFSANTQGEYWLVDPLDGTKEFISGNGEFTVNIALIHQGRPVLGVVYAPVLAHTYLAASGHGAFKQLDDGLSQPIGVAKHVAGCKWRVAGSRSHAGEGMQAWLSRLGEHEFIAMGSSLKFCLVAEGQADVYPRLGPTSLWDTAAAQCVLEQAGGAVVSLQGQALSYSSPQQRLNPQFIAHSNDEALRRLLKIAC